MVVALSLKISDVAGHEIMALHCFLRRFFADFGFLNFEPVGFSSFHHRAVLTQNFEFSRLFSVILLIWKF